MEITSRQLEIIEAAGKILTSSGVSGLTIKNLAKEMDFSESAIYRHFTSKEEIILAMLEYLARTIDEHLQNAIPITDDPKAKFVAMFQSQFAFFESHRHFVVVVFSDGLLKESQSINEAILKLLGIIVKNLFPILLEGQNKGVFSESPGEIDLLETRLKLELISTTGKTSAFRAMGYTIYQYPSNQLKFDLKEAYFDYYTKHVDFRFGQQTNSWGKADEINPTDILNPQDLNNITEDKSIRKIGLFQTKADFKYYDFVLTALWKPVFKYMEIPPLDSRWAFFSIPGVTQLPPPTLPDSKWENTEWAFKLERTISSVDLSLSYFDGWDNIFTPVLRMDNTTHQLSLDKLETHRTKMFGADFATSIASVGFWGEGAYFVTEDNDGIDPLIKNPYFQFVVGADYQFKKNYKLNIQYFQEVTTKIDDDAEEASEEKLLSKLGIGLPLKQALTCRFEKKFGQAEEYKFELFGIYDLKYQGIYVVPKFSYSPEDGFNIEAGYNLFDGVEPSFWANFQHNDQMYLKCTYSF